MIEFLENFKSQFLYLDAVSVFVFGACIGSFLNVCIYRMPKGESLLWPSSHSAQGRRLAWYENVPILSWLMLRGKDRVSGEAFSIRYLIVEFLTAVLFLLLWEYYEPGLAIVGMCFFALLIPASFIDCDHMLIPDLFTVGGAGLGLLLSVIFPELHVADLGDQPWILNAFRSLSFSVIGLLIASACALWLMLVGGLILKKQVMGEGDIYFLGCIGAFCGWQGGVFALFGGAILGSLVLLPLSLMGAKLPQPSAVSNDTETSGLKLGAAVPFGPWLAMAAMLYYLGLHKWVDAYFMRFDRLF